MSKYDTRTGFDVIHHPRKLLLSKKTEFMEALGINSHRLAGAIHDLDADPVTRLQEETLNLGLNAVLYGQLRQVEAALDRLDLGEYGYCLSCNNPIATNRLRSVPWTSYCLECQEGTGFLDPAEEIGVGGRN